MTATNKSVPELLLDEQPVSIVYYQPAPSANGSPGHDFVITYCNKTAASSSQTTVKELVGQRITPTVNTHPELNAMVYKQLSQVWQTGKTFETVYYNPMLQKHFQVIRNKVENGVLTVARDVTEEVHLREEKDRQTELANKILDASLNGWFYCEAMRNDKGEVEDFRFIRINPGFTRLVKMEAREVVGKTHLTLFPTSKTNGIHELNCRVVNEKVAERKELRYKGEKIDAWYDVVVAPLGDDGIVVTFADITHTKRKEIEAANLANTLTTVINTVQVGIFTFAPEYDAKGKIVDFRFTMVNPTLSSYVAQEPETLIGALGSEWFPGYLTNGVFDMYRDTFLTGKTQRQQFHYNEDGIDVYIDLQSTRIGEEVLVTFSDYTPLQLAQLELQKSIRELQRSNHNLEEFTRAASHDLKEPVRKIQLFSDRLKNAIGKDINDTARDLFSRMENAATRMRMLIDDLLDYSHANSTAFVQETVDISEVVNNVISDLEVMIEETGTVIEVEDLPVIEGNRRQLQQLFLNLINNSIKYRKHGINPHIFIHARITTGEESGLNIPDADHSRSFLLIEVSDNGIGFDQSDSEKIFNVFTRLHNNREYSGTGIGLSIANKVMENHGGYIFARGVKGQGATFSLLFPR